MTFFSLNQFPIYVDDFFFRCSNDARINDALVIYNPIDAMIVTPVLPRSRKTLEEHIELIRTSDVKKAIIAAKDIGFLRRCPNLDYLEIHPAIDSVDFDYSPLYDMPNIKYLFAETMYGLRAMYDVDEKVKVANIDYSRIKGLKKTVLSGVQGHFNVHLAESLVSMDTVNYPNSDNLFGRIPITSLEHLAVTESTIRSIEGIQEASKLRKIELWYNRRLTDISALRYLSESLGYLEIDSCDKINDFCVLQELHNLEFLTLKGSNTLDDVYFLREMPNLKYLHLEMNVKNGDLSPCEGIPYVRIKNRKHYSHKDKDMQKNYTDPDTMYSYRYI